MEAKTSRKVPFGWPVRLRCRCVRDFSDSFAQRISETQEFKGHREGALLGFYLLFKVALFRRRIRETSSRAIPWREE